ncbi:2-C-methyl-D-erythritol 4-phosphate cytidylyltransferase [Alteromonas mediterranea]|uniref:2-C-methyl-D-erythritol 4-phosphate cytidylyltransferase n=1 Tax=Alteromonas mediterranea (strain DSM 17117 / CIP 110805 / LMG 28347 / Deep ecotype) TaxID=1774373 RepID=ISPD_ALTMD|nr:2-C-methyl-D-erythritol 4-phosphate cytidylyltransferase [Alteromonas mediterranea]B4RZG5.2 RecName: Full=2-C-methyl-D-erythritol 4-phosphate cytidylyltransferase; AltName: Full=4-diphosphocytidyl-2C-methyl-D-erythritol synthase; AltName: Full=MEP cytidylyltransferase; Short=MCT [Alteromonas mediterranea DE]AEA96825.1 2-C-methyl-D-erythritol 4-phosphate cytidylyltransferase [Alteromonas mediterranea DE]MEA3380922.1 2-C-methyl-D-erythritol 4-phosphate cytidylyltransferase [Pseudomonadota bacte
MTSPRVVAVIPAAGVGSRMQADRPKQYLSLNGKTILEHTIDALLNHPLIDDVIVAISQGDEYFDQLGLRQKPIRVVDGGKERADSVLNGILSLDENDWALVHDAARPCVDDADISNLLSLIGSEDVTGGILATPVRDTMKRVKPSSNIISHTEDRNGLWHALTPQLFPAMLLKRALQEGLAQGVSITDEASAMEFAGHSVAMVSGSPANIKITHPADLPLAEFYLKQKFSAQGDSAKN